MEKMLLAIYRFFEKRRPVFFFVFLTSFLLCALLASRIRLEEDISKILPNDRKVAQLTSIFQESKFADRLILTISSKNTQAVQPDRLILAGDSLVQGLMTRLAPYIANLEYKVDDSAIAGMTGMVEDYLPCFLDSPDYAWIDQIMQADSVRQLLEQDLHILETPAGIAMKRFIRNDPVGLNLRAMRKLSRTSADGQFELYDNAILTRDHKHLMVFVRPAFPPGNTGKNAAMVRELDQLTAALTTGPFQDLHIEYFGASAVSAGNAIQLRKDSAYTLGIILVFLLLFITWYFRRLRAPVLILIPVLYGAVFSLAWIYLIRGSISVIALGTGAVILGVAISYSLHVYNHYLHTKSIEEVIADLAWPLTVGSFTTIAGFLCLEFVKSEMLKDLGLFAAFSLIGAAICSLIFMPHFLRSAKQEDNHAGHGYAWIDRISTSRPEKNRLLIAGIFLLTIFFAFYAGRVGFETDLTDMNYMSPQLRQSEANLNRVMGQSLRQVYLVAEGRDLQEALRNAEQAGPLVEDLQRNRIIAQRSGLNGLLLSDSLQKRKILAWRNFWTKDKRDRLLSLLRQEGSALHFSGDAFNRFEQMLGRDFVPMDSETLAGIRKGLPGDYITEKEGRATVVTLLGVAPQNKAAVYRAFDRKPGITVLDRQYITERFVEIINADFTRIAWLTSIMVFSVLLLTYGRIELTLVSFIPMFIAWIWILGIMGLAGIRFNIINIILSALIFGLGDDYSLFIMDGLLEEYRTGKKNLPSFKSSIVLSAVTTLAGLGVLIFAKHPALRSIAVISIIGMLCVVFIAQTLIPFLFSLLIGNRVRKNRFPWTAWSLAKSLFAYLYFTIGALLLTAAGFILIRINPFNREKGKRVYHRALSAYAWSVMYIMKNVRKKIINPLQEDFSRPCVVICNHQSFIDILMTALLHPRLILLTNRWVWNSPVFGQVVRLADYYPVQEGIDQSIGLLAGRVAQGYSIVVFPEGTRSDDGTVKRFHKGAFFLAEKLGLDILPIVIHGSGYTISKGDFLIKDGRVCLEFLPRISPGDLRFGAGYAARAKNIGRYFRQAYEDLKQRQEQPLFFHEQLVRNYLYKGPVLEWYLKVKLRLEKDYRLFHDLMPARGSILDLGCGYGFLSYMLRFAGPGRSVTGVDYDEKKIDIAKHCFSRDGKIDFHCADMLAYPLENYDGIVLSDVLHYLAPGQQEKLVSGCLEHLLPGGRLLIREGNAEISTRHRRTRLSEFFSTRLLGFNKTGPHGLSFLSGSQLTEWARQRQFEIRVIPDSGLTSNMIFVISKELAPAE